MLGWVYWGYSFLQTVFVCVRLYVYNKKKKSLGAIIDIRPLRNVRNHNHIYLDGSIIAAFRTCDWSLKALTGGSYCALWRLRVLYEYDFHLGRITAVTADRLNFVFGEGRSTVSYFIKLILLRKLSTRQGLNTIFNNVVFKAVMEPNSS